MMIIISLIFHWTIFLFSFMLTARLTRVLAPTGPGGGNQHPRERKQDGDPDLGHAVYLLLMLTNVYKKKKQKTESRGPSFEICDFIVKLGSVTVSNVFKVKQH